MKRFTSVCFFYTCGFAINSLPMAALLLILSDCAGNGVFRLDLVSSVPSTGGSGVVLFKFEVEVEGGWASVLANSGPQVSQFSHVLSAAS